LSWSWLRPVFQATRHQTAVQQLYVGTIWPVVNVIIIILRSLPIFGGKKLRFFLKKNNVLNKFFLPK
jgi:hypothetical protein